jgi:hypothetical protein
MKAYNKTLTQILYTGNQYIIPVFQRFYVWDTDEWNQLWDDITEIYEESQFQMTHFMGAIVVLYGEYTESNVHTFQVIDGQQRTITMSLLLCALRNIAKELNQENLVNEIEGYYLFHSPNTENEILRVFPRQRDREVFVGAMKNTIDGDSNNSKIYQALEFFTGKVQSLVEASDNVGMTLSRIFNIFRNQLEFVWIELERENPYRIFRSLNSTGVDLEESDLIRNFVFMQVRIDEQDNFDDTYWKKLESYFQDDKGKLNSRLFSDFFRDFLMRNGRYVTLKTVFSAFENVYEDADPINLTQTLTRIAGYYDNIRGSSPHPSDNVNQILTKIRGLRTTTIYPLLIHLLTRFDDDEISETQFVEVVDMLTSFILRRYMTADNSRQYGRWFVSLCGEVTKSDNIPDTVKQFLVSKGFPDDFRFKESMLRFPIYGRDYTRYVLLSLEHYHPHKERADMSNSEIEHIMPQTLTDEWKTYLGNDYELIYNEWVNTIGNLTLSSYNQEMSNKPFDFKKSEFYENSNIILNKQLCEYSEWREPEIVDRGNKLVTIACEIWKAP